MTVLIVAACTLVAVAAIWGLWLRLRHEDRTDPWAGYTVQPVEGFADLGPMPAEIAHEEHPAWVEYTKVGYPPSLLSRYGPVDEAPAAAPAPSLPAAAPPVTPLAAVEARADEIKAIQDMPLDEYVQLLERDWRHETGSFTLDLTGGA